MELFSKHMCLEKGVFIMVHSLHTLANFLFGLGAIVPMSISNDISMELKAMSGYKIENPRGLGFSITSDNANSRYTVSMKAGEVWINGYLKKETSIRLKEHNGEINLIRFNKDGTLIVSASTDHNARVWDLEGNCIATFGHDNIIYSARFSKKGDMVVSALHSGMIYVWDLNGVCLASLKAHSGVVCSARFNRYGDKIVTASFDHSIGILNLNNGCFRMLRGHGGKVISARFSGDGKLIVSVSDDGIVKIWDVESEKCLVTLTSNFENRKGIISARFSGDGKLIVTVSKEGVAEIWDVNGKYLAYCKDTFCITSAKFSKCGNGIITLSSDGSVKFWKALVSLKSKEDYLQFLLVQHERCGKNSIWKALPQPLPQYISDFVLEPRYNIFL